MSRFSTTSNEVMKTIKWITQIRYFMDRAIILFIVDFVRKERLVVLVSRSGECRVTLSPVSLTLARVNNFEISLKTTRSPIVCHGGMSAGVREIFLVPLQPFPTILFPCFLVCNVIPAQLTVNCQKYTVSYENLGGKRCFVCILVGKYLQHK